MNESTLTDNRREALGHVRAGRVCYDLHTATWLMWDPTGKAFEPQVGRSGRTFREMNSYRWIECDAGRVNDQGFQVVTLTATGLALLDAN